MDIFIDMDSTLNDFTSGYLKYYNKLYGTNHKLKKKDLTQYEISKCIPGLTDEEAISARGKVFSTPNFWIDIPIYTHAADTVEWICGNFNTYILTAPWIEYKDCAREKYEWVEKYLPFFPLDKIIFCHDKHVIHSDSLLIDDNVNNLHSFKGKTLKINYPYNKEAVVNFKADNWKQMLKVMKSIKKDLDKNGRLTKF